MEKSKQQRCHCEAWKYPYMREKKPGPTRKTFRSTRMRDRREPMQKQRDQKMAQKRNEHYEFMLGRRSEPRFPRNLEISLACNLPSSCKLPLVAHPRKSGETDRNTRATRTALNVIARWRNAKGRSTLRYGISTSLPIDCRDSMNLCASAACTSGNDLPTSSFSLPSAISLNDSSIPRRITSGTAPTV